MVMVAMVQMCGGSVEKTLVLRGAAAMANCCDCADVLGEC